MTASSFVSREDDSAWPKKNIVGKQELEVRIDNEHISFEVSLS
jgi:protein mago nashi